MTVLSDNCTIRGLVINRFSGSGIDIGAYATPPGVYNAVVAGNYLGTDVSGTVALGNGGAGVYLGASGYITIGGTDAGAGNLISGNYVGGILTDGSDFLTVQGNRIGTNAAGTAALGNGPGSGIVFRYGLAEHAQIGGTTEAARNLISGNIGDGILLYGARNDQIQGNYIGADITGAVALPNHANGIGSTNGSFGNTIGGNVAGAGNLISGNLGYGVILTQGTHDTVIAGNRIGTDATGTRALGDGTGVAIAGLGDGSGDMANNRIGTDGDGVGDALERNVISGNAEFGIQIQGASNGRVLGTIIAGNYIGTDVTGTAALGNAEGVWLNDWSQNSVVGGTAAGTGNLIAFNTDYGVQVSGAGAVGNLIAGDVIRNNTHDGVFVYNGATGASILGDSISASGGLGIHLDAASNANHNQAAPALLAAITTPVGTTVTGALTSTPDATFRVEFFANAGLDASGNAEGQTYLGSATVTTDASGGAAFTQTFTASLAGQYITATATDAGGDTSEFSLAVQALAASTVVTNTNDSGAGSLRQAIFSANALPGLDTITFAIPKSDTGYNAATQSFTIRPLSPLPTITDPVVIDGTTQPGSPGHPQIELDGSAAGGATGEGDGLVITAGNSTVRGLAINRFSGAGIRVSGQGNDVIEGNYLGTDVTGTSRLGNDFGVEIIFGATNNTVGGTTAAARNVISGNDSFGVYITGAGATGNVVEGNYIGTDKTGTSALGNGGDGVQIGGAANNTVGGTTAAARNVISGNGSEGVAISGTGNVVEGNYIGTDKTGTSALGNGIGVSIFAANNTVGGTTASARNVISGNVAGIDISGAGATGNVVEGDFIGTDKTGTSALGNAVGVLIAGAANNTVGGTTPAARNVISGNGLDGIDISGAGATGNVVEGNYIGLDVTGSSALGNGDGVLIEQGANNTVGGTTAAARNVISGNNTGIHLSGAGTTGNVVAGNYIGTDRTGTSTLRDKAGSGVLIDNGASNNRIGTDGNGVADAAERNVISGNSTGIVIFQQANGNVVAGNYIGTDASGKAALGNLYGIQITYGSSNNYIGVDASGQANPADRNVISGNASYGVYLYGGATGNVIANNTIGVSASGAAALPNGVGVGIDGASGNIIGAPTAWANTIAFSTGVGVNVQGSGVGDSIRGNAIYGNAGLGIQLSGGGNNLQSAPVLTWAVAGTGFTTVAGTFTGAPNATFTLDFYANAQPGPGGYGEGQTYFGSATVTTDGSGAAAFTQTFARNLLGQYLTATATDAAGDTSEFSLAVQATGLVVTNTNDSGLGSLRQAIQAANELPGLDTITFAIPTTDPGYSAATQSFAIRPLSALPTITDPVVIDGTTEPGSPGHSQIELDGSATGFRADGLDITADDSTVRGLAINRFGGSGIHITGQGNDVIEGNYIGTDVTGASALGNGYGVFIDRAADNTVGGTTAAARNVISGNNFGVYIFSATGGNVVAGDYIGTDKTGTSALGNSEGVFITGDDNTVGGSTAGARNLISGNFNDGVSISFGLGNVVEGNYIGTDKTGASALGNREGVFIFNAANNTVGGSTAGARNVISGNFSYGVYIYDASGIVVAGNYIGTDKTGTSALGNDTGVFAFVSQFNTVGGSTAGAGNVISGNRIGVEFFGGPGGQNVVAGNYIGTDKIGTSALSNGIGVLIHMEQGDTVGGTTTAARNVISGNSGDGVEISGATGSTFEENMVAGNYIGVDQSGTKALANQGDGVRIFDGASGNQIGAPGAAANIIAFNGGAGVRVEGASAYGTSIYNSIRGNAIYANVGLGIDLTGGGNNLQSAPVLAVARSGAQTLVTGSFSGTPNATYTLDFYATDSKGVTRWIGSGSFTSGGGGTSNFFFFVGTTKKGELITATATDPFGDTSEFSPAVQAK